MDREEEYRLWGEGRIVIPLSEEGGRLATVPIAKGGRR
jgi:hypothetical protein